MSYSTEAIRELAVRACKNGEPITQVANMYSVHRTTVYRWVRRKTIEKTLSRKSGSGRPEKLTNKEITKLTKMILKPASKFGFDTDFWTIKRIISVAKERLSITLSKTRMYNILYNEDYSYKKPEKRFYEANEKDQKAWLEDEIPKIKKYVKKYKGILYFEDEANIALQCVLGKTWGPVGKTSIQKATGNRASISAMSAITASGKLIFTLHEKKITSIEVINFLDQMLRQHPRRHLIVIMDRARPHTSKMTKKYIESQKRLHVFYLPARSPEFNPDEKVWNHLKNNELKSHQAKNKEELKNLTKRKLFSMAKRPKLLKALFKRCEIAPLLY